MHTPGHALHHYAVVDAAHRSIFTGDTFGISYRELDTAQGAFIIPTTPPTQFDPEQHLASIDRMLAYGPRVDVPHALQPRHRRAALRAAAQRADPRVRAHRARARRRLPTPRPASARELRALWLRLARAARLPLSDEEIERVLANDLTLNTQGLIAWLARHPT